MKTNKIIFNPEDNTFTSGKKPFKDLPKSEQDRIVNRFRNFLIKNTKLSDYEEDSMWMSYRYCIGRHTIASHSRALDIAKNCYKRMSEERSIFTAYDMNREIEQKLLFNYPNFHFPITSLNKIYTTAVDIVCEFIEDNNIKSIKDFIKYKDVHIILTDNERGYKVETVTWEEYLRPKVNNIVKNLLYDEREITEDKAWEYYLKWQENHDSVPVFINKEFTEISKNMPNIKYYYMHDFEDLFVWNNLIHLFDLEHHHKSILTNGEEVEWFWTWQEKSEKHDDGYYYKTFGYEKVRMPIDNNFNFTKYIPDESIKENIY